MGWFTEILGSVAGPLIGGLFASDANEDAADQASGARYAAIDAMRDANRESIAAMRQGNELASQHLRRIEANAAPGVSHLQRIVASDPNRLTSSQEIELADTARGLNAGLARSGLRGAGRSVARVFGDVMNRTKSGMLDKNKSRTDAAGTALAVPSTQAVTAQANLASQQGQNEARIHSNFGTNQANMITGAGDINAAATTANGNIGSETIGNIIGSIFSREDRGSRYDS